MLTHSDAHKRIAYLFYTSILMKPSASKRAQTQVVLVGDGIRVSVGKHWGSFIGFPYFACYQRIKEFRTVFRSCGNTENSDQKKFTIPSTAYRSLHKTFSIFSPLFNEAVSCCDHIMSMIGKKWGWSNGVIMKTGDNWITYLLHGAESFLRS